MPLETGTYISDLNASNPTATDGKSAGDDHLRLIKSTVKATFPNISGAVTATHSELNILDGATLSTAELNVLDGVTASTAELNTLDGVTATAAELNVLDGVSGVAAADLTAIGGLSSATDAKASIVNGTGWTLLTSAGHGSFLYKIGTKWAYFAAKTWVTGAAAFTDIMTLPAGYRPVDTLAFTGVFYDSSASTQYMIHFYMNSSGLVGGLHSGGGSPVIGASPALAAADIIYIPPTLIRLA